MPQASGSRHGMGYVKELVYGETPDTPIFTALRHNSTTLGLQKATFGSEELRSDRMIADFRAGTKSVEGNIVTELSFGSHDDLIAAALGGAWTGNVLKAGILRESFTIERHFADIVQYIRYRGVQVDTMELVMNTGGLVGLTFGLMAQAQDPLAATIITGATYPPAATSAAMDALTGVITEGGAAIAVVTEATLSLSNALAARYVIGSAESLEPSIGRSNLTGSISAYFENASLYNKFINDTASSLSVQASDGTNTYTFLVPKVKYTGGDVPVSGEGPVTIAMPFQAVYDSVTGTSFQITRSA